MQFTLANGILAKIKNGRYFPIAYTSDITSKVCANAKGTIVTKTTTTVARKGLNYDNMKAVKQGKANGTLPATNGGLTWGSWKIGFEKVFIEHKGTDYLRIYPNFKQSKSTYFVNGVETSKTDLMASGIMQPSYWNATEPMCLTIKVSGIESIG